MRFIDNLVAVFFYSVGTQQFYESHY